MPPYPMKNSLKLVAGLALSGLFLTAQAQTAPPMQDGKMDKDKDKMGKKHKEKMNGEKMKAKM